MITSWSSASQTYSVLPGINGETYSTAVISELSHEQEQQIAALVQDVCTACSIGIDL